MKKHMENMTKWFVFLYGGLKKHKKIVHAFNLIFIAGGLVLEIHPLADFGFLFLSIICEIDT